MTVGPNFLADLNLSYLQAVLGQHMDRAHLWSSIHPLPDAHHVIEQSLATLANEKSSQVAAVSVATLVQAMPTLAHQDAASGLDSTIQHQRMMILNHLAWTWLEQLATERTRSAMKLAQPPDHWVESVAFQIINFTTARNNSANINPPQSLRNLPQPAAPYKWKLTRTAKLPAGSELEIYVAEEVVNVLQQWLRFSLSGFSRSQAWFVGHLISIAGEDILLLDIVWNAHRYLKSKVLGNDGLHEIKRGHFTNFIEDLQHHPLSKLDSDESSSLRQIGDIFRRFRGGTSSIPSFTPNTNHSGTGVIVEIPVYQSLRPLKKRLIEGASSQRSKRTKVNTGNIGSAPSSSVAPDVGDNPIPGHRTILAFIEELLPLIGDMDDCSLDDMTPMMLKVHKSRDSLLPFRELGPSRLRATKPDGPFEMKFLSTRFGLLSILIWRVITFGTRVAQDHSMRFTSLSQWQKIVDRYKSNPSYLCNIRVYGAPNRNRVPGLGTDFWQAIELVGNQWEEMMRRDFTYREVFDFFMMDKKDLGKGSGGQEMRKGNGGRVMPEESNGPGIGVKRRGRSEKPKGTRGARTAKPYAEQSGLFPQVGRLTAHLLAADCFYARYQRSPDAEELGTTVYTLKMGALKGLKKLGLLPNTNTTEAQTRDAFTALYNFLDSHLSSDQKARMKFDAIMVEHVICKYSKLHPRRRKGNVAEDSDTDGYDVDEEDEAAEEQ
jgi:hypothetical protein